MYNAGYRQYILWDTDVAPHASVSGVTGTGKTYFSKILLARISKTIPKCRIAVCDYKGDKDFQFLDGCEHFYRFNECLTGLKYFHSLLTTAQQTSKTSGFHLLLLDEWSAFLSSLPKKDSEEAKQLLSTLLMLGRSFDLHVIVSQQRLSADSFAQVRDCLNLTIYLGNPSKEVAGMLFNDYKSLLSNDRKRGTGYMLENCANFQTIIVPQISSMDAVNAAIREAVLR